MIKMIIFCFFYYQIDSAMIRGLVSSFIFNSQVLRQACQKKSKNEITLDCSHTFLKLSQMIFYLLHLFQ